MSNKGAPSLLPASSVATMVFSLWLVATAVAAFLHQSAVSPLKADLAELRSVRYGLFNVDQWKGPIAGAIAREIRGLRLDTTREDLNSTIERAMVTALADSMKDLSRQVQETMPPSVWRMSGMDAVFKRAHALVAESKALRLAATALAAQLTSVIDSEANRRRLETYILERLDRALEQTFAKVDTGPIKVLLQRYDSDSVNLAVDVLSDRLVRLERYGGWLLLALWVGVAGLLVCLFLGWNANVMPTVIAAAGALIMLLVSLPLPMMDIEGRIVSISFQIAGEPIVFSDQVLFFESKGIAGVTHSLISNGQFGPVVVAGLIITFSVILPISKMLMGVQMALTPEKQRSAFYRYMALESGKWSMADVMALAIFMSFIGLNGLIDYQLGMLGALQETAVTRNNTSFGNGFHLFLAYCVVSLGISARLAKARP